MKKGKDCQEILSRHCPWVVGVILGTHAFIHSLSSLFCGLAALFLLSCTTPTNLNRRLRFLSSFLCLLRA